MVTRYWFSICCALAFTMNSSAAIEPGNAKAFKIQYQGRTSYLLGTSQDFNARVFKLPDKILAGLDEVDEVILETDRFDEQGKLISEPGPKISIHKIVAFKPTELQPKAKTIARGLFTNSDLKEFYHRLSPGLVHFFALYFADQIFSDNHTNVANSFAAANGDIKDRFGAIKLRPSHRSAANYLLGSDLSNEELFRRAHKYFIKKGSSVDSGSGIDSEIYREARRRGLGILGLHKTEPYSDVIEASLAIVTESDVNETLIWIGQMTAQKNAAQNWYNVLHSSYLNENLHIRYFEIDNNNFMDLTHSVAAFPFRSPAEIRLKEYNQNRHQYWVSELLSRMKKSPVFIAVGLGHVIGSKKHKSLLDYLRERGAIVEPIITCESFLGSD